MNNLKKKILSVLTVKIPLYVFLIFLIAMLFIFSSHIYFHRSTTKRNRPLISLLNADSLKSKTLSSQNAISLHESEATIIQKKISILKGALNEIINKNYSTGFANSISITFQRLKSKEGFSINENEKYIPGSIMKVALMMTFLKHSEHDPSILDKIILDTLSTSISYPQTFETAGIVKGKKYKVKELIESMIIKSDNYATFFLNNLIDLNESDTLFNLLGWNLDESIFNGHFQMTGNEYSRIMNMLYNHTYLSMENSVYALKLLSQTVFNSGFMNLLPKGLRVSHKFGEQFENNEKELHESGVFYLNDNPYILTVMTKGKNLNHLTMILSEISKCVYDFEKDNK